MSETVKTIAAAMGVDAQTLRVVAQNIANADSVAYRRQVPLTHADFGADVAGARFATPSADVPQFAVGTDPQLGTLRSTGQPLDLALEGQGFFVVAGAQGEAVTRRGDFHIDAAGVLVTASGHAVLGTRGPMQLTGQPSVDAEGWVRAGGEVIDRLRIVELPSSTEIQAIGDGLFAPQGSALPVESGTARVRQGFLETSNVSAVGEMLRLMELTRHFETLQKFARSHHEMLNTAIGVLGRV